MTMKLTDETFTEFVNKLTEVLERHFEMINRLAKITSLTVPAVVTGMMTREALDILLDLLLEGDENAAHLKEVLTNIALSEGRVMPAAPEEAQKSFSELLAELEKLIEDSRNKESEDKEQFKNEQSN